MLVFSIVVLLISQLTLTTGDSPCSELNLIPSSNSKSTDENYSIEIEIFNSSYVLKVSLIMKQRLSDTSWFIMGASNSLKLIGSWEPVRSVDGQSIRCSSLSEQAVTNPSSIFVNLNQLTFAFYWMAPPSFNNTVVFVATIYERNRTTNSFSSRSIQSNTIQIIPKYGRERVRDVNPGRTFSETWIESVQRIFFSSILYIITLSKWWNMYHGSDVFILSMCGTLEWSFLQSS